jgi:Transglycosylase-like domain
MNMRLARRAILKVSAGFFLAILALAAYALPASAATSGGGGYGHPYYCGDGDGDGYDIPCSELGRTNDYRPMARHYYAPRRYTGARALVLTAHYSGSSSMQRCIIARESGGNAGAVNPSSGAGGLYQFLPSTWHALGFSGLPEYASVATQTAAFDKAVSQSGYSDWTAYDGCLSLNLSGRDRFVIESVSTPTR